MIFNQVKKKQVKRKYLAPLLRLLLSELSDSVDWEIPKVPMRIPKMKQPVNAARAKRIFLLSI